MTQRPQYRRIVVKLSGESLCAGGGFGVDASCLSSLAAELSSVAAGGVQLGLVVGGGNFLRGRHLQDDPQIQRVTGDQMGMLATVINALALRDALARAGATARVMSAVPMGTVCEPFNRAKAVRHLEKGRVVLFAGGTGHPFFTTDTCAALRALEIDADVLLKATKVDGVFDSDPAKNPDAKKYDRLTYLQILQDRLGVMDLAAIGLCMERKLPILVCQLSAPGNLARAVAGERVGTLVSDSPGE